MNLVYIFSVLSLRKSPLRGNRTPCISNLPLRHVVIKGSWKKSWLLLNMMATFNNEYQVCFLGFLKHFHGNLIKCIFWILSKQWQSTWRCNGTQHKINIYNKLCSKINIALVVYVYSQLKYVCLMYSTMSIFTCTDTKNIYWGAQ